MTARSWHLVAAGLPADWFRRLAEWDAFMAQAGAMGYSRREAQAVVAGVAELAKRVPWPVDVLDVAELVLARGDLER